VVQAGPRAALLFSDSEVSVDLVDGVPDEPEQEQQEEGAAKAEAPARPKTPQKAPAAIATATPKKAKAAAPVSPVAPLHQVGRSVGRSIDRWGRRVACHGVSGYAWRGCFRLDVLAGGEACLLDRAALHRVAGRQRQRRRHLRGAHLGQHAEGPTIRQGQGLYGRGRGTSSVSESRPGLSR
jgi:hypothetical protein